MHSNFNWYECVLYIKWVELSAIQCDFAGFRKYWLLVIVYFRSTQKRDLHYLEVEQYICLSAVHDAQIKMAICYYLSSVHVQLFGEDG